MATCDLETFQESVMYIMDPLSQSQQDDVAEGSNFTPQWREIPMHNKSGTCTEFIVYTNITFKRLSTQNYKIPQAKFLDDLAKLLDPDSNDATCKNLSGGCTKLLGVKRQDMNMNFNGDNQYVAEIRVSTMNTTDRDNTIASLTHLSTNFQSLKKNSGNESERYEVTAMQTPKSVNVPISRDQMLNKNKIKEDEIAPGYFKPLQTQCKFEKHRVGPNKGKVDRTKPGKCTNWEGTSYANKTCLGLKTCQDIPEYKFRKGQFEQIMQHVTDQTGGLTWEPKEENWEEIRNEQIQAAHDLYDQQKMSTPTPTPTPTPGSVDSSTPLSTEIESDNKPTVKPQGDCVTDVNLDCVDVDSFCPPGPPLNEKDDSKETIKELLAAMGASENCVTEATSSQDSDLGSQIIKNDFFTNQTAVANANWWTGITVAASNTVNNKTSVLNDFGTHESHVSNSIRESAKSTACGNILVDISKVSTAVHNISCEINKYVRNSKFATSSTASIKITAGGEGFDRVYSDWNATTVRLQQNQSALQIEQFKLLSNNPTPELKEALIASLNTAQKTLDRHLSKDPGSVNIEGSQIAIIKNTKIKAVNQLQQRSKELIKTNFDSLVKTIAENEISQNFQGATLTPQTKAAFNNVANNVLTDEQNKKDDTEIEETFEVDEAGDIVISGLTQVNLIGTSITIESNIEIINKGLVEKARERAEEIAVKFAAEQTKTFNQTQSGEGRDYSTILHALAGLQDDPGGRGHFAQNIIAVFVPITIIIIAIIAVPLALIIFRRKKKTPENYQPGPPLPAGPGPPYPPLSAGPGPGPAQGSYPQVNSAYDSSVSQPYYNGTKLIKKLLKKK